MKTRNEVSIITRQQYMAELSKLLSFMFKEDRGEILKEYNDMLDNAEDEQALLESFGSPTKLAVHISRTYGKDDRCAIPAAEPAEKKPEPEQPPAPKVDYVDIIEEIRREKAVEEGIEYTPIFFKEEPAPEEPEEPDIEVEVFEEEAPVEEESPVEEEAPTEEETPVEEEAPAEEETPAEEEAPDEPQKLTVKKTSVGLLVLYLIPAIPIGLALLCVMLAAELAIFAAGAVVLIAAFKLLGFTFSGMDMFADIIICLGVSLGVLAVGVLVMWLGLWLILVSVPGLIRGIVGLGRKLCVREVSVDG